jgi:hypothetical protein
MDDDQAERLDPPEPLESSHCAGLAGDAAIVIDPRLADLWGLVWSLDPEPDQRGSVLPGTLAALLRLAYVQGYADAHSEQRSGVLYRELGLRIPGTRRVTAAARKSGRRSRRGKALPGSSGT